MINNNHHRRSRSKTPKNGSQEPEAELEQAKEIYKNGSQEQGPFLEGAESWEPVKKRAWISSTDNNIFYIY